MLHNLCELICETELKSGQLKQSVCFELQQFVFSQLCVMPTLASQHLCTVAMKWTMTGVCLCCSLIRLTEMFCFHGVLVSTGSFHIY